MFRRFKFAFLILGGAGLWAVSLHAADWLTHSGDPQRTGWQQAETTITKDNVKDFQLLWKLTLPDNQQKALHSLMEPLIVVVWPFVTTHVPPESEEFRREVEPLLVPPAPSLYVPPVMNKSRNVSLLPLPEFSDCFW